MARLLWLVLLAGPVFADARYLLAYRVKANLLVQLGARVAGLSKLNSEGEQVLLKGSKVMVKGETSTLIVDYGTANVVIIDHTDKTFERLKLEDLKKRLAADFPTALVEGLKKLFGGDGSATTAKVEAMGDAAEMPSLARFRMKHGLGYLLPAMEALTPLVPSVDQKLRTVRGREGLPTGLRVAIGAKVLDAVVEIREYREGPVEEREFAVPAGYEEVK